MYLMIMAAAMFILAPDVPDYWIFVAFEDYYYNGIEFGCAGLDSSAKRACGEHVDPVKVRTLYRLCKKGYELLPSTIMEICCNADG